MLKYFFAFYFLFICFCFLLYSFARLFFYVCIYVIFDVSTYEQYLSNHLFIYLFCTALSFYFLLLHLLPPPIPPSRHVQSDKKCFMVTVGRPLEGKGLLGSSSFHVHYELRAKQGDLEKATVRKRKTCRMFSL